MTSHFEEDLSSFDHVSFLDLSEATLTITKLIYFFPILRNGRRAVL